MATTTISPTSQEVNITLRLSDISVLNDIKKALKLFRGVENVRTSTAKTRTKKLTGIEQALLDVKEGRVTKWDSVDQMFETLMSES